MKERHPIISVREHQIRIHDTNYFKNHFSRFQIFNIINSTNTKLPCDVERKVIDPRYEENL